MNPRVPILIAALACASPIAAQGTAEGPRLLRVVASSGGVVLSLDSAGIARTGDSTFLVDAVYEFPADTTRQLAADRQVETQEMDCGGTRVRGRSVAFYAGGSPVPVSVPDSAATSGWQPVSEDELPIFQTICQYLLASFATSLPVTLEAGSADRPPVLVNGEIVAHTLERTYPRELAARGIGGTVRMRFQIDADGHVAPETVRVLWATRPEFIEAALAMARRLRFRPAKVGGRPVAVWATVPLSFSMNQGGPPPLPGLRQRGGPTLPSPAPR